MIRALGLALCGVAAAATTARARCLDSATTAFREPFESTLGRSSAARCFLRTGLARENRADVRVFRHGPR